jgi:hypothetical protein
MRTSGDLVLRSTAASSADRVKSSSVRKASRVVEIGLSSSSEIV